MQPARGGGAGVAALAEAEASSRERVLPGGSCVNAYAKSVRPGSTNPTAVIVEMVLRVRPPTE
jgi:hypothetical protein